MHESHETDIGFFTIEPRTLLSELLRPRQLGDLSQPQRLIDRLQRMVDTQSLMNMLFYGGAGTGKTSAARILMKLLGPEDFIEIDGSHVARDHFIAKRIPQFCSTISFSGVKICFIDEADDMSRNAQDALRKIIEDYSDNVRFLLAGYDARKIIPGIRSRLTEIPFDIAEADRAEIEDRLIRRLEEKLSDGGICYESERLKQIVSDNFPDFRAIANQLEFEFA
jgi:replication factor C small subunit